MSTISGIGASAWSTMSSTRSAAARPPGGMDPSKMKEELFAKVDADGSGKVDKTELQGMLDATVNKSGGTTRAEDVFARADGDGDGNLSADELDAGMKSLMPPPANTLEFAQSRGGAEGPKGPPPGPPPSASEASSTGELDPLDTNEDGTVSEQERAAGELAEAMNDLLKAIDGNGDSSISDSERDTFLQMVSAATEQVSQTTSGANADGSSDASQDSARNGSFDVTEFANMVLRQYAQAAADPAAEGVGTTLSVAA